MFVGVYINYWGYVNNLFYIVGALFIIVFVVVFVFFCINRVFFGVMKNGCFDLGFLVVIFVYCLGVIAGDSV